MNIYISIETALRELDSKLLLAIIAASRGHEVLVSDTESILKGLKRNILRPGIFHTKSLSPGFTKIEKHTIIINKGCKVTSIDEEGGLIDYGYKKMLKFRYSAKTIKQASAVFTWGAEDFKALKKYFGKYRNKIHMTGSPRVDLWRSEFSNYWKKNLNKPYLLIPSNFGAALSFLSFYEKLMIRKRRNQFVKDPNRLKDLLKLEGEQFKLIAHFIEAIKHLSNAKKYNIVLRPHPSENVEIWNILLEKIPNVTVIREDNISLWVKNAFAIMHNGCTTALEAHFFKKPIITYAPFKAYYDGKLANDLGQKVTSIHELSKKIDKILFDYLKQKKINKPLPKILLNKIFVDENETAAKKMIKVWESISEENFLKTNNWFLFKCSLRIMKLNGMRANLFHNVPKINKRNFKFPPFEREKIFLKIDKLIKILGIKQKLHREFLADRTLLIKRM
jgi:surface carbohydrate biosynthesis protein